MTFEGLSNVCAKLEPASSRNNDEINVLQNFTMHALCDGLQVMNISKMIKGFSL